MIKIDRSLISHGSDNKSGAVVLRAALAMARELGKDVVAVGMERDEDVAYVRALGCDYAQGFYFGEPMTEREVMTLLNALAKTTRRDEKREKKKKRAEEDSPPATQTPAAAEQGALKPVPGQTSATGAVYPLPVPIPKPASDDAGKRGRRGAMFGFLRRAVGGVSSAGTAFGTMLRGLFKPARKPRPRPAQQRPERPKVPPALQQAPSPRDRFAGIDPAVADRNPRQPVPTARQPAPPPPPPPPPSARPPAQPPQMAETLPESPPEFHQAEGTHGRRRRG